MIDLLIFTVLVGYGENRVYGQLVFCIYILNGQDPSQYVYRLAVLNKLEFGKKFSNNPRYKIPRKSLQWWKSCFTRIDRWTARQMDSQIDQTKLVVVLRNLRTRLK
jgi:hypothetical protein